MRATEHLSDAYIRKDALDLIEAELVLILADRKRVVRALSWLSAVAAHLFQVPIAIVSLVDHDRIWSKSDHGLELCEVGREPGLCASAIFCQTFIPFETVLGDLTKRKRART